MGDCPRIAVVALNAGPTVLPELGTQIGGLETFCWSLSRAMAKAGIPVDFLIRTTRRPSRKVIDDVTLLIVREPLRNIRKRVSEQVTVTHSFPWLKVKKWSPTLLWNVPVLATARLCRKPKPIVERIEKLLKNRKPDLILTAGVSEESRAALAVARTLNIPSLLWFQSNSDLDERFWSDPSFRNAYGVTSEAAIGCVRDASMLIAQTRLQQDLLRKVSGREAVLIPNPVDTARFQPRFPSLIGSGVLWVGRYDRMHKRPLLARELARMCPDIPFTLILNPGGDPTVEAEFHQDLPSNITVLPSLTRDEMVLRFRNFRLFLSTGSPEHEGFPNVLLEAAASGVPSVSLHDFDQFLSLSEAGKVTGSDLPRAASELSRLYHDPEQIRDLAKKGRQYVERWNSLPSIVNQFLPLARGLASPDEPVTASTVANSGSLTP